MTYNDPIASAQGATKVSELFTDDAIALIGSQVGESAIKVIEQMVQLSRDALTKQNYILRSDNNALALWTGSQLQFDSNATTNDILFDILQTDSATVRTTTLRLQASITANDATHFKSVSLSDGDLLYIELNYANATGGTIVVENAAGGGSIVAGKTAKIISTSSSAVGMPQLLNPISGTSTTLYIPLALRKGTNLYWIPHGIMWPTGTTSPVGAIIVQGFTAYPNYFAATEAQFTTALTQANAVGGGVILLTAPITLTSSKIIPVNTKVLGRHMGINKITFNAGSYIQLSDGSELCGLYCEAAAAFTGSMIRTTSSIRACVRDTRIDLTSSSNSAGNIGINVQANWFRSLNCKIDGVASTSRIGVNFTSGSNNAAIDNVYT